MSENGNGQPKYEGQKVKIGGVEYILPELSVRQFRESRELFTKLNDENALAIILKALNRNYPNVKIEDIEDEVGVGEASRMLLMVRGLSGLLRTGPQPAADRGLTVQ
jgi:hypothetical protein